MVLLFGARLFVTGRVSQMKFKPGEKFKSGDMVVPLSDRNGGSIYDDLLGKETSRLVGGVTLAIVVSTVFIDDDNVWEAFVVDGSGVVGWCGARGLRLAVKA